MSEITKTDEAIEKRIPGIVWISLATVAIFLYFFELNIPLLGPDEPRYAQVAREMFARGDWVTPTLGGAHWFEKPALLYWFEIASYSVFGVTEFAARFGSALSGLGTIAALWLWGRTSGPEALAEPNNSPDKHEFANWLALIAASTIGIIVFSRGASFDIIVTFPMTAALVSFFIFDRSASDKFKERYLPLILFYIFIGVSLLAKGLIGVVFPFAIVGCYHLASRRLPGKAFILSVFWGSLLAVAVAGTWYLPMYQRNGYEFIDEFFIQHHFQRFTSNKYLHPQPFIFFFWVLPLMTIPWLPFFVAAAWRQARSIIVRFRTGKSSAPAFASQVHLFAWIWLLIPLFFFSFSGSKLPGYILPSVPPAIMLTALYLYPLINRSVKWRRFVLAASVGTFVVSITLLLFVVPKFAEIDSVKPLMQAAAVRGYSTNPVINLHMISHNSEFYFAGRLARDTSGKLRRFNSNPEVRDFILANNGTPVLAMIPLEHLKELTRDQVLRSEVLRENGEMAIAILALP